jgi:ABC-2 type transport system ATP-binding protein
MRELLQNLAKQGRTVLVSSHLLSEMEILADDVVIIAAGKLVTHGPVEKIVDSVGASGVRVRVRTPNPAELAAAVQGAGGTMHPNGGGAHLVDGLDAPAVGGLALRAGVELHELVAERPDLEQVFLELTQGKAAIR